MTTRAVVDLGDKSSLTISSGDQRMLRFENFEIHEIIVHKRDKIFSCDFVWELAQSTSTVVGRIFPKSQNEISRCESAIRRSFEYFSRIFEKLSDVNSSLEKHSDGK